MSSNKTSLGLNQWDATDLIKRLDFNRDNEIINEVLERKADRDYVEGQLAGKVNGKWRVYTSLGELGITLGTESFDQIVDCMADKSTLIYIVGSGSVGAPIYPNAYGTVIVTKYMNARVIFEFTDAADSSQWIGNYHAGDTVPWKDWKRLAIAEPPQWNNLVLSQGVEGTNTRYRKEGNVVYIDGWLTRAPVSTALFTLPVGFRPKYWTTFSLATSLSDLRRTVRMDIGNDGIAKYMDSNNGDTVIQGGASITCSFTAEQ